MKPRDYFSLFAAATMLCASCQLQTPPADRSVTHPIGKAVDETAGAQARADAARRERDSKLGASLEQIGIAAAKLPASPEQIIISAEQTFSLSLLAGAPVSDNDRASAAERVALFEQGRTAEARKAYADAASKASELLAKIATAEAERDAALTRARDAIATAEAKLAEQARQYAADMAALKLKQQAALDAARSAAEAREKFWQTMIFSGLGALCLLGAGGMMYFRSVIPAFGAQAALWLAAAGAALIVTGILVRAISRLIDDHPYLFWGGICAAGAAVLITAGLVISNHHHAKDAAATSPIPATT